MKVKKRGTKSLENDERQVFIYTCLYIYTYTHQKYANLLLMLLELYTKQKKQSWCIC